MTPEEKLIAELARATKQTTHTITTVLLQAAHDDITLQETIDRLDKLTPQQASHLTKN